MDNLKKPQGKNDLIITDSQQSSKMKNKKLEDESPLTINKKDNSYETKKAPMLEDMIKNNEDIQISQSENTRKNSVRRKNKVKDVENGKDNSLPKRRRGPSIKRKKRNASIRRPRKNEEVGGTIKVVGKISAKLESLIQRLGQNTNENISNTRTENKYQMGPKIKAALEKFNKKKEEESQPIPFKPAKYKSVTLPDSDKGIKYDPKFQKARYIQEIVESDYEDEEYDEEYDEEEEEEEEDDSEDEDINESKDKDKKSQKKNKNDISLKKEVKTDEKDNQDKKKRKKRKKKDGVLNLSHEYSSGSGDNSDNDKSHKKKKKRRKRRKKKENNSKSSYSDIEESEESEEESDETQNKEDKNKKKKGMKKKKTFNFSESEKNEEKKENNNNDNNNNDEEGRFQRKLERHKSGKGIEVTKSKDGSYSVSSLSSKSINRSNAKSKNSSFDKENLKISKDNPINIINEKKNNIEDKNGLLIKKKPGKSVEYDKFSFVEYTVKNYHPKPVTIWKKQVKKYMLCKQIDFSIFAQVPKKVVHKKVVMFNVNNNDVNKKKNNNNRFGARKSVAVSINNNSLFNFAQKFDISKYEEKLSNIKKKKNNLINEKKTINTEFEKRRKRYQSILLTDDKNFNDFTKKLNQNNSNKKVNFDKLTDPKKRRMSVYQILQKRGLNPNFPDKSNLESKEDHTIHDSNSNKKSEINNRYNDEKSNKLEKIPEKEDDIIKETHFGVKYIVFQNKNELKTIYKKEKWKLSISKITSIFLKAIKPKEVKNKINSKVFQKNIKNNPQLEKIYKNKFDNDNNKIEKISLNYNGNKKKEIKINNISNEKKEEEEEDESSNSSRSNSITQKNLINKFNETRLKKDELQKLYKKENKKPNSNEQLLLNFDLGNHYDKETKKGDKELVKSVKSGDYINSSDDKNDFINYFSDNKFNRANKKNYTTQSRKVNRNHDYTFDEKEKKVGKVKSKKARIKKFVSSNKDEPDPSDDERRRKGNLYDYYSGKIPNKRKQYLNYENGKENTLNSRNKKNKIELKYENTSHHKNKSLNINPGKNSDISYRNNSTSKKHKNQKNNISHVGHNSGLITSYRHKIFEEISDKNNKNNQTSKKNNQNIMNKSMSALRRKNEFKIKLNSSMEMLKIDAIKSKMKKRLIEIDNKLIDAVNYYNGPIDISCISLKNYTQTVKDLNKRALKNGYKCSKCETNYYELTNGFKSFFVEIVKIRNNMLYYLIVKNQ